jgi:DNA-binding PadR family transcriptional regulator
MKLTGGQKMTNEVQREIEYLRIGHLTHYLLQLIENLQKVEMQPYFALIAQELEKKRGLGASKSVLFSRLKILCEEGFLRVELGASSNPRAKRPVRYYFLTTKGRTLQRELAREQKRIVESIASYVQLN